MRIEITDRNRKVTGLWNDGSENTEESQNEDCV